MHWLNNFSPVLMEDFTLLHWLMLFFVYAFLGWCTEVAFAAVNEGRFVNRGFLNGPICPIYGFGVLAVILLLRPVMDNLALLFFGSVLVTSLLEFLTGFVLEKIFHAKWWDYTDRKFNVMGYICLEFSLLWGVACVLVIRLVHPLLCGLTGLLPRTLMIVLASLFSGLMIADLAATLSAIHKLNVRLRRLTELSQEIRAFSDGLGAVISDKTLAARERAAAGEERIRGEVQHLSELRSETNRQWEQRVGNLSERLDGLIEGIDRGRKAEKARLQQMKSRLEELVGHRSAMQARLLKAFPGLNGGRHREALETLRERYAQKRRKKG